MSEDDFKKYIDDMVSQNHRKYYPPNSTSQKVSIKIMLNKVVL